MSWAAARRPSAPIELERNPRRGYPTRHLATAIGRCKSLLARLLRHFPRRLATRQRGWGGLASLFFHPGLNRLRLVVWDCYR
jgi:hypothetical protein